MEAIKEFILAQSLELVLLLLVYFFGGVRQFILAKTQEWKADKTETEIKTTQRIGVIVVEAVEQIAKARGWNGERKLVEAVARLQGELKQHGIEITDKHAETLVESIVLEMNETGLVILDELTKP